MTDKKQGYQPENVLLTSPPNCKSGVITPPFDGMTVKELMANAEKCLEAFEVRDIIKQYQETINRQNAEIERLKDENYHLRGYSDSIVKRMQYLFQSKTILQFDEIDRRTYQYKKDVTKFDDEFKRYKEAFEKMSEEKVFSVDFDIHSIKAEAKKEVFEELISMCNAPYWCVWLSEINDLAEKMGVKVDAD